MQYPGYRTLNQWQTAKKHVHTYHAFIAEIGWLDPIVNFICQWTDDQELSDTLFSFYTLKTNLKFMVKARAS